MDDMKQFSQEEVEDLIKRFDIAVPFNKIIVTLNVYEDENGLISSEDGLDAEQYVIAAGPRSYLEEGTKVALDIEKLLVKSTLPEDQYQQTTSLQIKTVEFEGYKFGLIDDSKVEYFYK